MGAGRANYAAALMVSLIGLVPVTGAAATSAGQVRVMLQNDDVAPNEIVRMAQLEVTRLFALIDVDILWVQEPADQDRVLRVKLTNWEPTDRKIPATALGLTNEGPHGTRRSYVVWPRVQRTALRADVGLDALLAVALAHEMGHLLLPVKSHGPRGLMRASWDDNDLRLAAAGLLHFSKDSAVKIALGLRSGTAIADKESKAGR